MKLIIYSVADEYVYNRKRFKCVSVEATNRKYLDSTAMRLSLIYEFNSAFKDRVTGIPTYTMGNVLHAIDKGTWKIRNGDDGNPATAMGMDGFYDDDEWEELRSMNDDTNKFIHNGMPPTDMDGQPLIVLPHDKMEKARLARLKKMASKIGIVGKDGVLIIKDAQDLSGSSDQ